MPSSANATDTLSSGQVAQILRCSQQSAIRAIDSGAIKGFRLPGSRFRRVMAKDLREYMAKNNLPLDRMEAYEQKNGLAEKQAVG